MDPSIYLGPAQIIDARQAKDLVTSDHVLPQLRADVTRVLIRTYDQAPQQKWDNDFRAIAASLIDDLAARGVRLIGVDTPSLDPQASKTMDAHLAVARHGPRHSGRARARRRSVWYL